MNESAAYFDPAGLARVGNLPLVARQIVEGFVGGCHRSPYHGFSVEFLDHRQYAPGDELRSVDWKVVARTDKYFVKRFEQETNLRTTILLDCSKSMAFAGKDISKLRFGSLLAAALTYLLLRQNDAVGLGIFDETLREFLPARAHPTQFGRLLERLENVKATEATNIAGVLHQIAERIRRRGLVIVISDLLDDIDAIADSLQHFRHRRHEVIVFHVLDDVELTFPFDRAAEFRDTEGGGRLTANPASLRKQYLERISAFTNRMRLECLKRKIGYELLNTSQPYDRALAAYLDKRARLG